MTRLFSIHLFCVISFDCYGRYQEGKRELAPKVETVVVTLEMSNKMPLLRMYEFLIYFNFSSDAE